ncbi:MAG: DNA mismatch repair endonuclease MutL [Eubacteriales bacterium]
MKEHFQNRIVKLPKSVYDKIAAGEVIERPVSVVKELIENSIDAGSTSIVVEIKKGGKEYIRITDNGVGIDKEEIELAFQRHATSKISVLADLDQIATLGFRGEALSSIVAVSHIELVTKPSLSEFGIQAFFENGEMVDFNEIGCENGTSVIVRDLFYNLPGRLKFLKADHVEAQLIIDLVTKLALANAEINFKLIRNGKIIFSTGGHKNIRSNIACLYEKELASSLLEVNMENVLGSLSIFFTNPSFSKSNRKFQVYFVNGRYVHDKLIEKAISSAFAERMPKGRYPAVFLFLTINPELIDVNIHPSKLEIKFLNENVVFNFIESAFKSGLSEMNSIPKIETKNYFSLNADLNENKNDGNQVDIIKLLESKRAFVNIDHSHNDSKYQEDAYPSENVPISSNIFETINRGDFKPDNDVINLKGNISNLKVAGNIFNTYILASDAENFYIIDQHAAHERVLFDRLKEAYLNEVKSNQALLIPLIINTNYIINETQSNILDTIIKLGFEMEPFGQRSFIVRSIPAFMSILESEIFLHDFLDNFNDEHALLIDSKIDKLISNSCKNAVKAHDILDIKEQTSLIIDLGNTDNPFSCPHGRPIILKLTISEIEKMFKRI